MSETKRMPRVIGSNEPTVVAPRPRIASPLLQGLTKRETSFLTQVHRMTKSVPLSDRARLIAIAVITKGIGKAKP